MKIHITVKVSPQESNLAAQVEQELREAIGNAGEVIVQRSSSPPSTAALEVLRSANPAVTAEKLIGAGACTGHELAVGLANIACSSIHDVASANKALALAQEPFFQPLVVEEIFRSVSSILSDNTVSEMEQRRAALILQTLVQWNQVSLAAAVRAAVVLLRVPETISAGAVVLAALTEPFYAEIKELVAEMSDVQNALQNSAGIMPIYESTFISDRLALSTPMDVSGATHVLSTQVGDDPHALGMAMASSAVYVATASQDGVIQTFDFTGKLAFDAIRIGGDRLPTALDIAARPRQLLLATAVPNGAPSIVMYSEQAAHPWWLDRLKIDRTPGKIITAARFLRSSGNHFCAAECGPSDGVIHVFDQARGTVTHTYTGHDDVITSLHIPASKEHLIVSTSRDRTALLFDLRARSKVCRLAAHSGAVTSASSEGDMIVVGGLDGRVTAGDLRSLNVPLGRKIFDSGVVRVALGPNYLCAVSCTSSLQLMTIQVAEMPAARVERVNGRLPCMDLAWVPSGQGFFGLFDSNIELVLCAPPA